VVVCPFFNWFVGWIPVTEKVTNIEHRLRNLTEVWRVVKDQLQVGLLKDFLAVLLSS